MIWIIVIIGILFVFVKFFVALSKDKDDLQGQTLDKKFNVIVNVINDYLYKGNGTIEKIDHREFNVYEIGSNQLIKFHYSTGQLTIDWRYKYFQKEIVHSKRYDNMRNLSLFEQEKIAKEFLQSGANKIEQHKIYVIKDGL